MATTPVPLLAALIPIVGQQGKEMMVSAFTAIHSAGIGMLCVGMILSVMYLIKNGAERKAANTPEGDLIAKGLVKGRDGKRPATIERDLLSPIWFGLFPPIVIAPAVFMFINWETALGSGVLAVGLGLLAWWLIPRMPASDVLYLAGYRVYLIAVASLAIALGLGAMLSYVLEVPLFREALGLFTSIGGLVLYGCYLLLGRMPRFRGEPAVFLSVAGFILIFAGLMVNSFTAPGV